MNHSRGKIARLPASIRDEVNQSIYDGKPYATIISWLAEQGYHGIRKQYISRWRAGGYQEWLRASERLDLLHFKRELAQQQAHAPDPVFHDAAIYIAQIQFYDALNRLDGSVLSNLVQKRPKEFLQLLKTFTHFNRYCLQRDKFRNSRAAKPSTEAH